MLIENHFLIVDRQSVIFQILFQKKYEKAILCS